MKKEVFYGEENPVEEKECVEERKETDKKQEDNQEVEEKKNEEIRDFGQAILHANRNDRVIYLLSIIGEIEGHECLPSNAKTTKYEHVLPKLAAIEDDSSVDGVLLILNTMGGDVESGLAIAEMIASMSKPTVSLVLGGSHSIGVPLAVATDYCAERNDGYSSCSNERYCDRCKADVRLLQTDAGSYHRIYYLTL